MTNLEKVIELASKIRIAFEDLAKRSNRKSNLTGYCIRASIQLHLAAKDLGISVSMVPSDFHVYNVYGDKIIDITATQFGKRKKVWIVNFNEANKTSHWQPRCNYRKEEIACSSIEELLCSGWWVYKRDINNDCRFVKKYLKTNEELTI